MDKGLPTPRQARFRAINRLLHDALKMPDDLQIVKIESVPGDMLGSIYITVEGPMCPFVTGMGVKDCDAIITEQEDGTITWQIKVRT